MKKNIRILAALLLAALLLPAMLSCTGGQPESTTAASPETTAAPEETTATPEITTADITTAIETTLAPETAAEPESPVIEPDEIIPASLYYTAGNRIASVSNGKIFKYNYVEGREYYLTSSLTAQDAGFPLVVYFSAKGVMLGVQFDNTPGKYIAADESKLEIPKNTSYIYVNARGVDAVMLSRSDKAQDPADTTGAVDADPNYIKPDEIMAASLYYTNGKRVASVSNGKIFKYNYVDGREYYLTSSLTAQDAGFPLVIYFNDKDVMIGTQFDNTPTKRIEAVEEKLNVPAGTAYIYVNARAVDAVMMSALDRPTYSGEQKEISILFVGNSLTQDAVAYLPYVLVNNYPEVNFKFYMWYIGGADLAKSYSYFTSGTLCEIFSVCENKQSWSNNQRKMSDILAEYTFDIVCMQEYFNYKDSFTESDLTAWNNCQKYITDNYKGKNELKFVALFHAPLRSNAQTVYDRTVAGCKLILEKTSAESVIAPGIAVKLALDTDLNKLGSQGGLSPDGTHCQEGLPCLLQSYVVLQWILERLGIDKKIADIDPRITATVFNKVNVPGVNMGNGVIPGTDAENKLAREIAVKAYEQSKTLFGS